MLASSEELFESRKYKGYYALLVEVFSCYLFEGYSRNLYKFKINRLAPLFTIKLTVHCQENYYICFFSLRMKPHLRRLFFLVIPLFLFSCGNASQENELLGNLAQDTLRYSIKKYTFPPLSNNARVQIENWSVYDDFYAEASTLNGLNLEGLRLKTGKLLSHTDSLSKKIPDTLFTSAIYSRLVILRTRVELLKQEVNRDRDVIEPARIEANIEEANNAIENLIVQLNEKFQKDGIDLQRIDNEKKELEKQKKFLDSVYRAELKDQKK